MRICSEQTGEGTIWPVDAALRPEGKAGPLIRTLASHLGYYERWAKTWEFQALLKARRWPATSTSAGSTSSGPADVWSAVERDGFVEDTQAMRRRVIEHIPAHQAERQLKLGSEGCATSSSPSSCSSSCTAAPTRRSASPPRSAPSPS